jgi:hypothetical protein
MVCEKKEKGENDKAYSTYIKRHLTHYGIEISLIDKIYKWRQWSRSYKTKQENEFEYKI